MKIAIIGSRGIPNNYGGFEQFAEYLSAGLVELGHKVYVYNSHNHSFQNSIWNGVNIIHCFDPEYKIGTFGQFIYDFNCIIDSRKRKFDVILQLGYTSSSIWNFLFKKTTRIVTNMDGLEWKRSKFSNSTKYFLKYAEKWAVKYSHTLISDSRGIQQYLLKKYHLKSEYIPYGAHIFNSPDPECLKEYQLSSGEYDLLIARIEPENNVETIISGFIQSKTKRKLVIVGNMNTKLGKKILSNFNDSRLIFLGYVSSLNILNNLRYYSNLYFHGHTVGGTNPSLLEAMASYALICAHQNIFNESILGKEAFYFENQFQITELLNSVNKSDFNSWQITNASKISCTYQWSKIISDYELVLKSF